MTTCWPGCNPVKISCIWFGNMSPPWTSTRRNFLSGVGTNTQSRSWKCMMALAGTAVVLLVQTRANRALKAVNVDLGSTIDATESLDVAAPSFGMDDEKYAAFMSRSLKAMKALRLR